MWIAPIATYEDLGWGTWWYGYHVSKWLHCRRAASFNECFSLLRLVVRDPDHGAALT